MRFLQLLSAAAMTAAVTAAPAPAMQHGKTTMKMMQPSSGNGHASTTTGKALYFSTNDATANSIVALPIFSDGSLGDGVAVSTGGKGMAGMNAMGVAGPDPLFSQSAVTVGDDFLFAVNAGSNTLSMFQINKHQPLDLKLVGTPQSTLGEFPMSVAYSSALKQACVVNGGAKDGVACFHVSAHGLSATRSSAAPIQLNQSTPPLGPPGTASHIFFTPDSSALHVTIKGNPATNTSTRLLTFSTNPSTSTSSMNVSTASPAGAGLLFGSDFASSGKLLASADPAFGVDVLDATTGNSLHRVTLPGQVAACWLKVAAVTGLAYVTDAGRGTVVAVDAAQGLVVQSLNLTSGFAGLFDSAISGDMMYALAPQKGAAGVAVLKLAPGSSGMMEVGAANVTGFRGMGLQTQGLALFDPAKAC